MKTDINRAYLSNFDTISVIFSHSEIDAKLSLLINDEIISDIQISHNFDSTIYEIKAHDFLIGNKLSVLFNNKEFIVDVNSIAQNALFDTYFAYDGIDLGANYNKDHTTFVLWAPLATKVRLKLVDKKKYIDMIRSDKGVYRADVEGDLDSKRYLYEVTINQKAILVRDPYALSATANEEYSVVIDLEKTERDLSLDKLPYMSKNIEATIYELHVRDFTIDKTTNIVHKGKYLGLTEENRVTSSNHPAGLDYLKYLGVSHVQLLPVLDYQTVDENNPDKSYNWGYDPMHMFVLEGSYSTNPNDGYSRINEFKKLVKTFHINGIRVNLDVVYNHFYEGEKTDLNKITPSYFFRMKNGKFENHSGCGNDFASERFMARKMILDSVWYLLNELKVDGLRFDLMGLIDLKTMKEIEKLAHEINPNIMLYGEGWDMCAITFDNSPLATMQKAKELPNIGFFNDRYRNIVKGLGGKAALDQPGYLLGNTSFQAGFKFAFVGSCLNYTYPSLFISPNQSINYVECHDNATLYDSLVLEDIDDTDTIIKMINKTLCLSIGVPFIHAGQEIGATKRNHHNTYNSGDNLNMFDYTLLDKKFDLATYLKVYLATRKMIPTFFVDDVYELKNLVYFVEKEGTFKIYLHAPKGEINSHILFINPTYRPVIFEGDEKMEYIIPSNIAKFQEYTSFIGFKSPQFKASILKVLK